MSATLRSFVYWIALVIGGAVVMAMMLITVVDVALREMGRPLLGAKEATEALLVVSVACALPMSVLGGKAVAIEGLVERLPQRFAKMLRVAGTVLSSALLGFLGVSTWKAAQDARDFEEASVMLQIPYHVLYVILAVCCITTAFCFLLVHARTKIND